MIVYHTTKTKASFRGIVDSNTLLPGWNVSALTDCYVHISLNPFHQGSWALDVIGDDTNEAWVFTLDIPDDTPLLPDPSDEGKYYNGDWVVHEGPLSVKVIDCVYIPNVQSWENQT